MLIRKLTEDDLEALWTFRLQALTESPEAFGATYEDTVARGKAMMSQRMRQDNEMFYLPSLSQFRL